MNSNFWQLKQGFILASGSPQRKRLLQSVYLEPDAVISPDIDECEQKGELPARYVKRIAVQKARAVFEEHPNKCVVAADTILAVGRRVIRKAHTVEEARAHLELLSGRTHRVITGLCVIAPDGRAITRVNSTSVKMKRLSKEDIDFILKTDEWKGVAGYRIEGIISAFIHRMNGSYDSVVGIPVYDVVHILRGILG